MSIRHYIMPFFLAAALNCAAQVELAPIFADNMVLQRGMKVPVWGKAEPGENVIIEFAGQRRNATADQNGGAFRWLEKGF